MRLSSRDFLEGLKINHEYFFKQIKSIGVSNRFIFDRSDISLIKEKFPTNTYVSEQVFQRADSILKGCKL